MTPSRLQVALDRCRQDDMLNTVQVAVRMLSPLLCPGQPVPDVRIEPLGDDVGGEFSVGPGPGGRPTISLDVSTLAGLSGWPGPDATKGERIEAAVLLVTHELAHHYQCRGEVNDGHHHGIDFTYIAQGFARRLGVRVPRDAEAAVQWPMNLYEHDDGTARRILDRARQAARERRVAQLLGGEASR
jgi:hypothetical protein